LRRRGQGERWRRGEALEPLWQDDADEHPRHQQSAWGGKLSPGCRPAPHSCGRGQRTRTGGWWGASGQRLWRGAQLALAMWMLVWVAAPGGGALDIARMARHARPLLQISMSPSQSAATGLDARCRR
jgi:hypothetical protein